jgi:3,4-dihydroxy 2-butanone 4-phosphate synthase/GTP cyclohydrolase II
MGQGTIVTIDEITKITLDTIEDALVDLRAGKMVIVVDDEDRENEGDFIMPAEIVTDKDITFMATHGRGLICAPLSSDIARRLELPLMVKGSNDHHQTAFTVSVDAKIGTTTGISSKDREKTLKLLSCPKTLASDFIRPGHIFPLIAKNGGVRERAGHTEAAVELSILAGFTPAGVICEILNTDGTCSRLPDLRIIADQFNLKLISIEDLISFKNKELK